VLTRIQQAGLGFLTRARDYQLLTHPKVQARLAGSCDLELVHPETGVLREIYEVGYLSDWMEPLFERELRCRVIVTKRPSLAHGEQVRSASCCDRAAGFRCAMETCGFAFPPRSGTVAAVRWLSSTSASTPVGTSPNKSVAFARVWRRVGSPKLLRGRSQESTRRGHRRKRPASWCGVMWVVARSDARGSRGCANNV
jgi:hypothetical protein